MLLIETVSICLAEWAAGRAWRPLGRGLAWPGGRGELVEQRRILGDLEGVPGLADLRDLPCPLDGRDLRVDGREGGLLGRWRRVLEVRTALRARSSWR